MQDLSAILAIAIQQIEHADSLAVLEQLRVHYLGKKSPISEYVKTLGQLPPEQRPAAGQAVNIAKEQLQALLKQQSEILTKQQLAQTLAAEAVDIALPGRGEARGSLHPITQTLAQIKALFQQVGFAIAEGPEVEDDYHNFSALNIPEHHPARAMHDTFYLGENQLLRTHTSTVQIRVLKNTPPPVRIIAPGRVYRCDSDLTHTPMFHQIEGLVVDEQTNFSELKAVLSGFLQAFFAKPDLVVRFRPSYFPFTEPSAELDVQCVLCQGQGCRFCSHTGWLEVLGCGMIHPQVLQAVNIDSERYSGFAFGMGIDRLVLLRHGIPDLRMIFDNDLRFLRQF